MKKFFRKLLCRRIYFDTAVKNFVSVLDTYKRNDDECFSGVITCVDFKERSLHIESSSCFKYGKPIVHTIPFDNIVTLSRMRDGRLRMWIKVED